MRASPPSVGSTRLIVALAVAVVLGVGAYLVAGKTSAEPLRPRQPVTVVAPASTPAELPDLGSVASIRESGGSVATFEKGALDHVLAVVASGKIPRQAGEAISIEAAAALDPKATAGRLFETAGFVRSLDKEGFESKANANWDQLWSLDLAQDVSDAAGAHVVVVSPGDSKALGGGAPTNAHMEGTPGEPLKNGDRVRVRGVFLQRRTGAIGGIPSLSQPTAVFVAREFRVTGPVKPPPTRLEDVAFAAIEDRFVGQTRDPADEAHWQMLAWARARGPVAIADELSSGTPPAQAWGSAQFLRWKKDVESDRDPKASDPREWTRSRRGRVFALTGHLGSVDSEDWAQVPQNVYDVDRRHIYWLLSDAYANAGIPIYSAFGLDSFPKVSTPKKGQEPPRVRIFGVFARNYTYTLPRIEQEITVPSFHLLYIERD